jgi:hypothetical protein
MEHLVHTKNRQFQSQAEPNNEQAEHRRRLEAAFGTSRQSHATQRNAQGGGRSVQSRKTNGKPMSARTLQLLQLKLAKTPEDIKKEGDKFLSQTKGELPDSLDVLLQFLRHPDESVQRKAMGEISALLSQGRIYPTIVLSSLLAELKKTAQDSATQDFINGLSMQMQKIQQTHFTPGLV